MPAPRRRQGRAADRYPAIAAVAAKLGARSFTLDGEAAAPAFARSGMPGATPLPPHGVLMLTVLGGLAEFERTLIKARTGEGRERAKMRGVRFGRPRKLSAHQRREAINRLDAGDAVVDVARTFGVDRATLYRLRAEIPD